MMECKLCGEETENRFNIDFKAVPICEGCATAVFIQQAMWYAKGEATAPKTTIGVVAESVHSFYKWALELQEKHPNEFKFKFRGKTHAFNEKTNTEYVCMSATHHTCGYTLHNFIELDGARTNKEFNKIMDSLMPCLMTRK